MSVPEAVVTPLPDQPAAPDMSDLDLASRFTERHGNHLRYVAKWGRWMAWDGVSWREDETYAVFDLVRKLCADLSCEANGKNEARSIASASTVAAVERLARADRQHAATVDQWDREPMVINTPAGVVNLVTGDLLGARPDLYPTKMTTVAPGGDCPLWRDFLNRVTGGDEDLARFYQRMAGYCLSGSTREHALFFAYGTGANGKSVFVNTLAAVVGDYHQGAPMETFMVNSGNRHETELAMLRGARLVTATETEDGRRWAESRVKTLTGGDPIPARFMRQDYFTFTPCFKLLIAGNHRPQLRAVDEAIRRRFHLLPFGVTIPARDRDPDLTDKLKDEHGGILQWAIEGCLEWQAVGLSPPPAVMNATADYLEAEDTLALFLDDCCNTNAGGQQTNSTEMFRAYRAWCDASGENPGTQKAFSTKLSERGFAKVRTRNGMSFEGVTIKPSYARGI